MILALKSTSTSRPEEPYIKYELAVLTSEGLDDARPFELRTPPTGEL